MPDLGGYIRAGAIYERGLYTDRSDISGEILQKISKSLYLKHNIEKKLILARSSTPFSLSSTELNHVSDEILLPVSP